MKFKKGNSGIYIKPENRGKFTATKKATGKTTEELTHSKNPITKKRAIFAQNAAKWKHEDGSKGVKSFPDLNKDGKVTKADVLVGRGVIPAKKMQAGTKSTKTKYTEEENKKTLQHIGSVHSPEYFKKRGIPEVGPPIRKGASADSTHYFAKKYDDLEKMEKGVIREMNDRKAPATKIPKEVKNRKLTKSDEFAHKYLTSQPKILSKIRGAQDEAKDNYFRQQDKGDKGVIFNYDKDGHFIGPKSSDKKMCGSKGMKYAEGTKSIKFKKPMMKRADGSYSQRGLYDNIRANKGSGKKPTPEMLKQEKKIKAKTGK
jgi:hypothetical protein